MLPRILLLLASLALLAIGGEGLYYLARSQQQITLTCADFTRSRPASAWLRLTNCDIDYVGAGFSEAGDGGITELYFPIRPVGQPRNTPAIVVAATRDTAALAEAQKTLGGGRQPTQEEFLVMMLKIVTQLKASREIQGYARTSTIDVLRARRVVSGLSAPIDPRFVMVDVHSNPSALVPAVEAAAGLLALVAFIVLTTRRRPKAPAPARAPAPAPAPAPAAASARIRGLMLLNLPSGAGPEDVEAAPPIGTRAQVLEMLWPSMPGIHPDARGRCVSRQPDHAITIDLGPGESVATVVIDAEGEGAMSAVRALLLRTGWKAFSPRLGRFIEPGDFK